MFIGSSQMVWRMRSATCRSSQLTHSQFIALKVKDAIVDEVRDLHGRRPDVDPRAPENFAAAIDDQTRAVFIESVSNPDGIVADIEAIASMGCHAAPVITALTVRYRDFRFIVPFVVQFGMYVSPVAYSSEVIREKFGAGWFALYCLNPLVGIIDGFRWAILGGDAVGFHLGTWLSLAVSIGLFVGGVAFFRKTERMFADII